MSTRQLWDSSLNSGSQLLGNQSKQQAKTGGDRTGALFSFLSGVGGGALAGGALGFFLGDNGGCMRSVSYTHLTLPTIYSV